MQSYINYFECLCFMRSDQANRATSIFLLLIIRKKEQLRLHVSPNDLFRPSAALFISSAITSHSDRAPKGAKKYFTVRASPESFLQTMKLCNTHANRLYYASLFVFLLTPLYTSKILIIKKKPLNKVLHSIFNPEYIFQQFQDICNTHAFFSVTYPSNSCTFIVCRGFDPLVLRCEFCVAEISESRLNISIYILFSIRQNTKNIQDRLSLVTINTHVTRMLLNYIN